MKRLITLATGCLFFALHAEVAVAQQTRIEAISIPNTGSPQRIWINEVTNSNIRHYQNPTTAALSDLSRSSLQAVFFPEPPALSTAIQQFRGREYRAAKDGFARVASEFRAVRPLENNPATRAAFFEIECLRLLGEYEEMSEKLGAINKGGLTRENELRQLELNLMWEAVGRQVWDRVEILAREFAGTRMPANQRAQVAYCLGLVLEQKGEANAAIQAFNEAMIIDAAASEVESRLAALAILRIYDADPDVQSAREAWGTEHARPNSKGHARLIEAGAVARIYEDFIGAGVPLPAAFKPYLEYQAPETES